MVVLPAHPEPVDALPRAKRRSPAVVTDKPKLSAADGAATRRTVARILRALAHSGLLSISREFSELPHSTATTREVRRRRWRLLAMSRGGYGRQAQESASVRLRAKRLVLGHIGMLRQRVPAQEVCNGRARSLEDLFQIV